MTKGEKIRILLNEGKKYPEIMRETGAAGSTVAYHAKMLGLRKRTFKRNVYDWSAIQNYYDAGHTLQEITERFGINPSSLFDAGNRGDFIKSTYTQERKALVKKTRVASGRTRTSVRIPNSELLIEKSVYSTGTVKKRILNEETIPYSCSGNLCPIAGIIGPKWAGNDIVLHLDHKNGIRNDHRLENLRFLCPNCHSQTSTYCGRNNKIDRI